jgi:hypothetical protein
MAPPNKGSKGKAIDMSTPWSEFFWDDRGYWISSRHGPSGGLEYDYRNSKRAQTSGLTPRAPGPNVIKGIDYSNCEPFDPAALEQTMTYVSTYPKPARAIGG